jgi:hypothetical protein
MKKIIDKKPENEYITLDQVDFSKSFIAFRRRSINKEIGYLILNGDSIVRAIVCDGHVDSHYPYYNEAKNIKKHIGGIFMKDFDVFVFDNQKEFFQWLADNVNQ